MCAAGHDGEDEKLYATVKAVGMELCPELQVTIPVGKERLDVDENPLNGNVDKKTGMAPIKPFTSPMSLIITGFAPVTDARGVLTPQLKLDSGETDLILVDLGRGQNRIGASCFARYSAKWLMYRLTSTTPKT